MKSAKNATNVGATHKVRALVSIGTLAAVGAFACSSDWSGDEPSAARQVRQRASTTSKVLVNLLGYVPEAAKVAVVVSGGTSGTWQVIDANGTPITGATGATTVKSADTNSGEVVHHADFSSFKTPGAGYKLRVTIDGTAHESETFDVRPNLYAHYGLPRAAIKYLYWKRSGMATMADSQFAISAHGAGHTGDTALTAYSGWRSGTFNVFGGWYDAGDHGKYAENQAFAAWALSNMFERMKSEADSSGTTLSNYDLAIDESGNSLPDFVDELVWGSQMMVGFLPDPFTHVASPGRTHLATNKCTSANWPPYPGRYEDDTSARYCMGPSTSATHAVARNLAHVARILKPYGSAATNVNVDGATTASGVADKFWAVAKEAFHRARTGGATNLLESDLNFSASESPGFNVGSGPYQDDDMADDEYAAAAEIHLTACAYGETSAVKSILTGHTYYGDIPSIPDWGTERVLGDADGEEAATGTLSLIAAHDALCSGTNALPAADLTTMRSNLITLADDVLSNLNGQNYPFYGADGDAVIWGSNGSQAHSGALLVMAFEQSGDKDYLRGAFRLMDYLLGTNPMRTSYVVGFGRKSGACCAVTSTHDRAMNAQTVTWGTLVGGPLSIQNNLNPSQQDPMTPKSGAPLKRFANTSGDGGSSWESEENAVNWNAGLASHAWALRVYADDLVQGCSSDAQCDDGSPCTTDTCSSGVCANTPMDCDDSDSCTVDSCVAGACEHVNTCCLGDSDCDDGDSCTNDVCSGGACSNPDNGSCASGSLQVLAMTDTGSAATDNWLRLQFKVKNTGTSSVDLGDVEVRYYFTKEPSGTLGTQNWGGTCARNFSETSAGPGATHYMAVTFPSSTLAANAETDNYNIGVHASSWGNFDETDDHSYKGDGTHTANDHIVVFMDGVRVNGKLPGVGDGGGSSGCQDDGDCDDGNACTNATCNADGTCSYSTPSCEDGNVCTTNSCDPAIGCTTTYNNLGCADDGNGCTDDVCNAGTCTHPDNGTCTGGCTDDGDCDDGDACTNDGCDTASGQCVWTTRNCNDGNACTSDSCDSQTGCVNTSLAAGAPCADDGDVCTSDVCDGSGSCTHADSGYCECDTNADCDDGDACTEDVCSGHLCSYEAISGCGGSGTGGSGGGTGGPCDGLCDNPIVHTSQSWCSGDLGVGEACHEFVGNVYGGNCGNMEGRSLSINGTAQTCSGNFNLPAARNGGFCFQASPGGVAWAYTCHW